MTDITAVGVGEGAVKDFKKYVKETYNETGVDFAIAFARGLANYMERHLLDVTRTHMENDGEKGE